MPKKASANAQESNALTYIPSGRQVGIYADALERIKASPLSAAIAAHNNKHFAHTRANGGASTTVGSSSPISSAPPSGANAPRR